MAILDDLARVDLPTVLAGLDPTCWRFARALHARAVELKALGDQVGARLACLLGDVCSLGIRLEDPQAAYGLRVEGGPSIAALTGEELADLEAIVNAVALPELQARIADVLLARRKHNAFAKLAVTQYLLAADALLTPDDWADASFRYARALYVSSPKATKVEHAAAIAHVKVLLDHRRGDETYFSAKLLEALWVVRADEPEVMAALAQAAADKADADRDWWRAREYLLLVAKWQRRAKQDTVATEALRQAAERYVCLADEAPMKIVAAGHLENAIQGLRMTSGNRERIDELHRRLLVVQKDSIAEYKPLGGAVDIADAVAEAKNRVAGLTLPQALVTLAAMWRPFQMKRLQAQVATLASKSPLFAVIGKSTANAEGKTIARRGPLLDAGDAKTRAERQAMLDHARAARESIVASTIAPAWGQIKREHYAGDREYLPLVHGSGFVPMGREPIFALGLAAGHNGDFAISLHVLIPQLEHAIRVLLRDAGLITSSLDEEGIQREMDLGGLLRAPEAAAVFDEDMLFDLQGLLVEANGSNRRNLACHGLLEVSQMADAESIYIWWLSLHLVVVGLAGAAVSDAPETEGEMPGALPASTPPGEAPGGDPATPGPVPT